MKYAILSDVHANLQALTAVLADARRMGAEQIVSLGDAVGYGPQPAEALKLLRTSCALALAGNHDDAVSGRVLAEDFIGLAADAVERHREALDSDARAWLKERPYTAEIEGAVCSHGDLVDPPKFYYIEDEADAGANFGTCEFTLAFVGHTHVPALFLTGASGTVYKTDPQDFTLEEGKRYIVNPGSVGYPRESNGVCRSSYVLYDSTARTIEFRYIPFSVASVLQRGRGPRTRRRLLIGALLVAGLALAVAALTLAIRPAPEVLSPADDPALVLAEQTLPLEAGRDELHANLVLAKRSAPANLRLRFRAADGLVLSEQTLTVRKSSERNLLGREFTCPKGAVTVDLTVLRGEAGADVRLVRFAPSL